MTLFFFGSEASTNNCRFTALSSAAFSSLPDDAKEISSWEFFFTYFDRAMLFFCSQYLNGNVWRICQLVTNKSVNANVHWLLCWRNGWHLHGVQWSDKIHMFKMQIIFCKRGIRRSIPAPEDPGWKSDTSVALSEAGNEKVTLSSDSSLQKKQQQKKTIQKFPLP